MDYSNALTERLVRYLEANPGEHKPVDVARALGEPTHPVAARLIYLSDRGRVARHRVNRSSSLYRYIPPVPAATPATV